MKNDINVINLNTKKLQFSDYWSPKIIADFNDSYVKLFKAKGEYVWHKHDHEDELFFVIRGTLKIEFRDKILELAPGELVVVPRGVEHKPVADVEAVIMLIESKETISTGDAKNTEDKKTTQGEWI